VARVIDAKIVLRVLVEILDSNSIAARRRFACQHEVALEYLVIASTNMGRLSSPWAERIPGSAA